MFFCCLSVWFWSFFFFLLLCVFVCVIQVSQCTCFPNVFLSVISGWLWIFSNLMFYLAVVLINIDFSCVPSCFPTVWLSCHVPCVRSCLLPSFISSISCWRLCSFLCFVIYVSLLVITIMRTNLSLFSFFAPLSSVQLSPHSWCI